MLNVEAFERIDRVIHETGRTKIMALLAAAESLSFKEIKEHLGMTDGNLSVHMRTLEEAGYVSVQKSFVDRKPRTEFSVTEEGREAFRRYIETMAEIVKQSQEAAQPRTTQSPTPQPSLLLPRKMAPAK